MLCISDSNKVGVKPQSAHIYVVEPDVISFTITRGNNWFLEKGLDYEINVRLNDAFGNNMHITDVCFTLPCSPF